MRACTHTVQLNAAQAHIELNWRKICAVLDGTSTLHRPGTCSRQGGILQAWQIGDCNQRSMPSGGHCSAASCLLQLLIASTVEIPSLSVRGSVAVSHVT
jgi:hypothetical protein